MQDLGFAGNYKALLYILHSIGIARYYAGIVTNTRYFISNISTLIGLYQSTKSYYSETLVAKWALMYTIWTFLFSYYIDHLRLWDQQIIKDFKKT